MRITSRLVSPLRRFHDEEGGVISVFGLFMLMTTCAVGAAAVDVTHFFTARTQLQISADIAAHAALYNRNLTGVTAETAKVYAIDAVKFGMPEETFGAVIEDTDIRFGSWDAQNETFTVDSDAAASVLVTTGREDANANPVTTFMFRIIGLWDMDVKAASVYTTYRYSCARDGLMSQINLDLQSNNGFFRGICMFAPIVELNSNNSFEETTVVTVADKESFLNYNQASTFDSNPGLWEALREGWFDFHILERIKDPAVADLRPGELPLDVAITSSAIDSLDRPPYIDRTLVGNVITLQPGARSAADFTPGRVHRVTCQENSSGTGAGNGNRINLQTGTYSQFILLTNCAVRMDGTVALEEVVISTTNTDTASIRVPSGNQHGLRLGKNDSCAEGGGSQIFTRGGVSTAAKLEVYGSQILALGEVRFAAGSGNATNQAEGVSIIAAGLIEGTSNMSFSGCPSGSNDVFETTYFRPAW